MRFEIFSKNELPSFDDVLKGKTHEEEWYWRLRARNGRIVADGAEGYASERNVRQAIERLLRTLDNQCCFAEVRKVKS